jgi:hypothetical protein
MKKFWWTLRDRYDNRIYMKYACVEYLICAQPKRITCRFRVPKEPGHRGWRGFQSRCVNIAYDIDSGKIFCEGGDSHETCVGPVKEYLLPEEIFEI